MSKREYPRSARLGELLRQIIADETERIDDDRMAFVGIASVEVDNDLFQATVYLSTLDADEAAERTVLAAFEDHRGQLKRAIGNQARVRRVPELSFQIDPSIRAGERIDSILRDLEVDDDT